MGKMCATILVFVVLLIMELETCCFARNTSSFLCFEGERKALLRFRASFFDPSNRLSSWKDRDCCAWQGVKCDRMTRHVTVLDLKYNETTIDNMLQSNMVDSSLLELKYLRYLDLSWIDFKRSKVPAFLGWMKQLQHLNLSWTNFNGAVPQNLGNLSSLRTLDLSGGGGLTVGNLMWVSNLSSLEYLDLSYVDLTSTRNIVKVLEMLPSLVVLRLSQSNLDKTHLTHACVNSTLLTNLHYLDLSSNWLDGGFPCFLPNMTSLRFLDLSENMYNFSGTHLLRLQKLAHLNLGFNSLHHEVDWISKFLQDRCSLKSLNIERNNLYGNISGLFKNSSGCWKKNIESLTLGSNEFHGHLPREIGELNQLVYLDLSGNSITGPIPTSLGKLSSLTGLDIGWNSLSGPIPSSVGDLKFLKVLSLLGNQLSGEIPTSLGQLSNLESLDLSFNYFKTTLSEAHFVKLSKLEELELESNILKFEVRQDWVPPFQLRKLNLKSCKIGGQFPLWLQTQKEVIMLDLSNCSISGTLPEWLHTMNSLEELNLPLNNITGPLPELASSLTTLDVSDNMITRVPSSIGHMMPRLKVLRLAQNFIHGEIPISLCEMQVLNVLDLSNNHLSGNLPDCWDNFTELWVARLSFNELSGAIPNSIGGAYSLEWLHLNDNALTGQLPSALKNCTSLKVLDVGGNNLAGKLPEWMGQGLLSLNILRLRDNDFYGEIPCAFCGLVQLQVMDLANNNLSGNIPRCFINFTAMMIIEESVGMYEAEWLGEHLSEVMKGVWMDYTKTSVYVVNLDLSSNHLVGEIPRELTTLSGLIGLNLSRNHLGGEIPAKIGDMKSLESLDLSSNDLVGKIPDSLSKLSFLSHLNLSNNNLHGHIPLGHQLQTLDDPGIYDGNPGLCGAPLPRKCVENHEAKNEDEDEDEEGGDKIWLYGVVIVGFAIGFWGVIGVMVVKRKWRQVYFRYIEMVITKMDQNGWVLRSPFLAGLLDIIV